MRQLHIVFREVSREKSAADANFYKINVTLNPADKHAHLRSVEIILQTSRKIQSDKADFDILFENIYLFEYKMKLYC